MLAKKGDSNRKQIATQVAIDQTVGVALFFPAYFYVYEVLESIVAIRGKYLCFVGLRCAIVAGSKLSLLIPRLCLAM